MLASLLLHQLYEAQVAIGERMLHQVKLRMARRIRRQLGRCAGAENFGDQGFSPVLTDRHGPLMQILNPDSGSRSP